MSDRDKLGQKLVYACRLGETAKAKRLIAEGAPVDWQDEDGNTPLIWAAEYNYMTIARELAWSLCDLKIPNKEGKTAAKVAKEKGNDALAEYLANQAPREQAQIRADPSSKEALREKYQPQAEQERLAAEQERLRDKLRYELGKKLYSACYHGRTAEARRLIGEGADVDYQTINGYAPLHRASGNGMTEIVRLLIENKCDVHVREEEYSTSALVFAAEGGNLAIVRMLVEEGCDITDCGRSDEYFSMAQFVRGECDDDIAEYLINEAPRVRFHSSARNESGQLHRIRGRSKRAADRDLKEIAGFDDHMLHKLAQFC